MTCPVEPGKTRHGPSGLSSRASISYRLLIRRRIRTFSGAASVALAGETGRLARITGPVPFGHLRIGTEQPRHCDALLRIIVVELCRDDLIRRDALLDPMLKRFHHIVLWISQ